MVLGHSHFAWTFVPFFTRVFFFARWIQGEIINSYHCHLVLMYPLMDTDLSYSHYTSDSLSNCMTTYHALVQRYPGTQPVSRLQSHLPWPKRSSCLEEAPQNYCEYMLTSFMRIKNIAPVLVCPITPERKRPLLPTVSTFQHLSATYCVCCTPTVGDSHGNWTFPHVNSTLKSYSGLIHRI